MAGRPDGDPAGGLSEKLAQQASRRPHLSLVPRKCALLVVDAIRCFLDPAGQAWLPAYEPVLPNIERLLECWRGFGGTVVFTRHCHRPDDDGGMLGRFYSSIIRCGDPGSDLVFDPLPGEHVVRKTSYDSFYGTLLEPLLRESGVSQVLVSGVLTHLCCETTARSAFVRGFQVYAAVDAMASRSPELHAGSLLAMADGFGVMMSTETVAGICGAV
jgi:nicotinamidase-related amidase